MIVTETDSDSPEQGGQPEAEAWLAMQGVAAWPAACDAVLSAWLAATSQPARDLFDVPALRFDHIVGRV